MALFFFCFRYSHVHFSKQKFVSIRNFTFFSNPEKHEIGFCEINKRNGIGYGKKMIWLLKA